jgi:hypothetical protein
MRKNKWAYLNKIIMEKSPDQTSTHTHTHRRHRHRPWYKKIGQTWQEIPVSRRRKIIKFLIGVIVCVLSVLLGAVIVYFV